MSDHQPAKREWLVRCRLVILVAAAVIAGLDRPVVADRPERPNLVVILFDDLGFSDLGCYGGEMDTPALDRLAADGLRMTRFYNTGRCAPSRAALLTGRYAHEVGLGWLTNDFGHPGYQDQIDPSVPLVSERLSEAGYRCYGVGKWHLCKINPETAEGPRENWPLRRGFQRYFGTIYGTGSYFRPPTLVQDDQLVAADSLTDDFYYTDAIGRRASEFVEQHVESDSDMPFFLYMAQFAPHAPLHARPEDIAIYRGRYDQGPEPIIKARLRQQVTMGIVPRQNAFASLDPDLPPWDSLNEAQQRHLSQKMEIYAAQVHRADRSVGRLVETLRRTNQLDHTVVIVLSDNGGASSGGAFGTPRDGAETSLDSKQSRHAIGRLWSRVSNTPFRLYKSFVHEGGIASPLIIHWPSGLRSHGIDRNNVGHVIDITPTLCDLAGIDRADASWRGRSLRPVMQGKQLPDRQLHFEHQGNRAWIDGDWKIVWRGKDGPWELYRLSNDRNEKHDLADQYPERVQQMAEQWHRRAERYQVLDYFPAPWAD